MSIKSYYGSESSGQIKIVKDLEYDISNKNIFKPHGKEWKSVITALGGDPVATGDYSLDGIPVRQYQRFAYQCGCRTHQLTIIRHRRVQADKANYRCRHCGESLRALVQ